MIFIIIALVSFNAFWIQKTQSQSEQMDTLKVAASQRESLSNELQFREEFIYQLTFGTILTDSLKATIRRENPDFISALSEKETLVFYYTEGACASCLIKVYQDMEILSENIGKDRMIVATTNKLSNAQINPDSLGFKNFSVRTLHLPIESLNQPFLFVANKNLNFKYFLVPELFDNLRHEYFIKLRPLLNDE